MSILYSKILGAANVSEAGMSGQELKLFDYNAIEIGEELGSYEYLLTQEMLDSFPGVHRRP